MWRYFLHKIKKTLPTNKFAQIRLFTAGIYAFSAWNLIILTFYFSIEKNIPNTPEKKQNFVEKMKGTNKEVEFIQIRGFNINNSKDEENETNIVAT